jgi:hypothetical protein
MKSLRSNPGVTPWGGQSISTTLAGEAGATIDPRPCSDCADKNWDCPYPQCGMSSNRNWNVRRHIQRIHQGIGIPSNQGDIIHKAHGEDSTRKHFGSYSNVLTQAIAAASMISSKRREKNIDPLDHALPILRKVAEFNTLLDQIRPSRQRHPTFFQGPYLPTYATVIPLSDNNIESHHNYFLDSGLQVVGYLGFLCTLCLVNHPLPIYNRKLINRLNEHREIRPIMTEHICNSRRALRFRSSPINTKIKIILNLYENLTETVMKEVNIWTNNRPCLTSHEFSPDAQMGNPIDLFPKNENHWSIRACRNKQILFNSFEELKDFIVSAHNATLGLFRIHSSSQDKEPKVPYFIAITPSYDDVSRRIPCQVVS